MNQGTHVQELTFEIFKRKKSGPVPGIPARRFNLSRPYLDFVRLVRPIDPMASARGTADYSECRYPVPKKLIAHVQGQRSRTLFISDSGVALKDFRTLGGFATDQL